MRGGNGWSDDIDDKRLSLSDVLRNTRRPSSVVDWSPYNKWINRRLNEQTTREINC